MNHSGTAPVPLRRHDTQSGTADLLTAILAISGELDLRSLLQRIVRAAAELTGARYGALAVVASDGSLDEFITMGLEGEAQSEPEPLRLAGLTGHRANGGSSAEHSPMDTFLGVPIKIRGTVFCNLYLTDKYDGRPFSPADEALVQALANPAGLVVENARSFWFSERRRQWLEASALLARAIQPPMPLHESLTLTVEHARNAAGAQLAAIVQFPSGSHPVIVAADADPSLDPVEVVRTVVADAKWVDQQTSSLDVVIGDRHALVVPLRTHLSDPGVLVVVVDKVRSSALFDEQEFLAEFADQAALSVDRAQAVIEREELAILSDRERIARDLHDHVIQRLFAAGLKLNTTFALDAGERRDSLVAEAIEDLDLTIRDIRTTIFGLSHPLDGPLETSLDDLLDSYAPLLGIQPALTLIGEPDRIPVEIADHLHAVLREALSNVARHAGATHVGVTLNVWARRVTLEVSDDGDGLGSAPRTGGLRNAAERAALLGGTLELADASPQGTVLTWRVPFEPGVVPVQPAPSNFEASTAAWVRRSTPSLARTLDT